MRSSHLRIGVVVLGLVGGVGLFMSHRGRAAEKGSVGDAKSPAEVRAFRENFLRDFKRIGLNTTPGDARFLRILVKSMRARRGVEVGTATGYGAIFMGMAFEENGGELITVDIDPKMVATARKNVKSVRLEKTVRVVEGDALEVLPTLEGKFDFVFIDAVKKDYYRYFKLIEPRLTDRAVIVADNVIKFGDAMPDFLGAMEKDPHYDMVIIRCSTLKGDGMAVIHKSP